ncbi:hypothetical protein DVS77_03760 [Mycolicibacterium moriokaense]|nr:hypothetical protein DVS77_03760 [Mycolicibacterium moriokaense]
MKKYWNLTEGVGLGIAGLVVSFLGWAGDGYKWIIIALSGAAIVASVALFLFQRSRDKADGSTE